MPRGSFVLGLCLCGVVLVGVGDKARCMPLCVQEDCVFLVEVGWGKLVCIAVGSYKGVPEVIESIGVEER